MKNMPRAIYIKFLLEIFKMPLNIIKKFKV